MSDFNTTIFQNATNSTGEPNLIGEADYWALLATSIIILITAIAWLASSFGGIGIIKDLIFE
jgi:hypothetical protein